MGFYLKNPTDLDLLGDLDDDQQDTSTKAQQPEVEDTPVVSPSSMANRGQNGGNTEYTPSDNSAFTPRSSNVLPDQAIRALDADDTGIKREPESEVFDGSTYKSGPTVSSYADIASNKGQAEQINKENWSLYNSIGEPGPMGMRFQKSVDPDTGETTTEFVPPPGMDPVTSTVLGSALKAIKSTASFAEWVGKNMPGALGPLAGAANAVNKVGETQDPDYKNKNTMNETIPTIPPKNWIEQAAQEIGSVVIGSIGGGSAVKNIASLPASKQALAEAAKLFMTQEMKKDPRNIAEKVSNFIRTNAPEYLGANVGATITTPANTDSVTGGLFEKTGMSPEQSDRVGTLLDNTLASGVLHTVFGGSKAALGYAHKTFLGGGAKKDTKEALAEFLLKQVDPDLEGVSKDEFSRRAKLFSDTIKNNADQDLGTFQFTRDPSVTMTTSADQYVSKAYDFLQPTMSPDEWKAFVKSKSALIADNLISLKRDFMKNSIVSSADSLLNEKVTSNIRNAANDLSTTEGIDNAGITLANRQLDDVRQVKTNLQDAAMKKGSTDAVIRQTQDSGLLSPIRPRATDPIAAVAAEEAQNNTLNQTAGKFIDTNVAAHRAMNQRFQDLQPGYHNYNKQKIAKAIMNVGMSEDVAGRILGLKSLTGEDAIKPKIYTTQDRFAGVKSPLRQKVDDLDNIDLKTLYNKVRPNISNEIKKLLDEKANPDTITAWSDLRKAIDQEANRSDNPKDFKAAMQGYKDYMGKFQPMEELGTVAEQANKASARGIGNADVRKNGRQLIDRALTGNADASGELLGAMRNALSSPDADTDVTLAKTLGDMAISAIAKGADTDGYTTAKAMRAGLAKYAPTMRKLDPTTFDEYNKAVQAMDAAEHGSSVATQELDQIKKLHDKRMADIDSNAATQFLQKEGSDYVGPTGDISKKFNSIFNSVDATAQLMDKATKTGDESVIKGIQSQYLRKLAHDLTTSRSISASGDGGVTQEVSGSTLRKVLSDSDRTPSRVMEIVFKDNPKMLEDTNLLLQELDLSLGVRNVRPQTFSSQTGIENERQRALNIIIASTLGVLNRTATTVGKFTSAVTRKMTEADQRKVDTIIPSLLVDSHYLSDTIDSVLKNKSKANMDRIANQLASFSIRNPIIKGAITSNKPETNYGADSPVDITIRGGNDDLTNQTNSAFGR